MCQQRKQKKGCGCACVCIYLGTLKKYSLLGKGYTRAVYDQKLPTNCDQYFQASTLWEELI